MDKKYQGSAIVAKAGLWYTICNFLFKGMVFITTPVFSRLMSKAELGEFSTFSSWVSILMVISSFDFSQSIIRSRLELEHDMDSYIWSILSLSTIWTAFLYLIVCLFMPFFSRLFSIQDRFIHVMFLYLFTAPAYSMLITKHRAMYRYKTFVALTGLMTVSGTLISLLLVIVMEDKLAGRIYGYYLPCIAIGLMIFIILAVRGRKIKLAHWRYACRLMLPLVPHVLSLYMLAQSDKIIITRICGKEYTAVYAIAYTAYSVVSVLFESMNKAWAPWLLDSLHHEKYGEIRKASKAYIIVFIVLVVGMLLLVPEIIMILGGKKYAGAIYCLPPLMTSCAVQFIYTMYVNIEFYKKKTVGVSLATMAATAINILLNFIFIPMDPAHGYVIAAYTTLTGYVILLILHYIMVRRLGLDHVYDISYIVKVLGSLLVVSGLMNLLYSRTILRYALVLVYGAVLLYAGYKNKDRILHLLRKKEADPVVKTS